MNEIYTELKTVCDTCTRRKLLSFERNGSITVNYKGGYETIDEIFRLVRKMITLLDVLRAENYVCTEMFYLNDLKSFIIQWSF